MYIIASSNSSIHILPQVISDGPYAVMVWLHGGGYFTGSNIQYPGHFMASYDVIVVVPNFRLDIIGSCFLKLKKNNKE